MANVINSSIIKTFLVQKRRKTPLKLSSQEELESRGGDGGSSSAGVFLPPLDGRTSGDVLPHQVELEGSGTLAAGVFHGEESARLSYLHCDKLCYTERLVFFI